MRALISCVSSSFGSLTSEDIATDSIAYIYAGDSPTVMFFTVFEYLSNANTLLDSSSAKYMSPS